MILVHSADIMDRKLPIEPSIVSPWPSLFTSQKAGEYPEELGT